MTRPCQGKPDGMYPISECSGGYMICKNEMDTYAVSPATISIVILLNY